MPPRAHNHNGFSSSEPPDIASPPPLPLSRGLAPSAVRHDPLPASFLDRFRPATTLSVDEERFPGLAVNGLPPPAAAAAASMEPVSMTARRPVPSRNHLPGSMTTKPHRAIKCYHCRMCEQVRTTANIIMRPHYAFYLSICPSVCPVRARNSKKKQKNAEKSELV